MSGFALKNARLVWYLVAIAVLGASVILLALMAGGADESAAGANNGNDGKAKVVGKVASVSGKTKGLTVKSPGGREQRLREGDQLHLNDVIDPDKGVVATLRLKIPDGISGDTELVFIAPGKGDEHKVTVERTGKLETKVVIGD